MMPTEHDHILGIVNSFVLNRYRERLRLKPLDLIEALPHDLPVKLDPRFVVKLSGAATCRVQDLIGSISTARTAFVLAGCGGTPEGEMSLSDAISAVDLDGSALASIELGQVAYYKAEPGFGKHGLQVDMYLLVKDPKRKQAVEQRAASLLRPPR